MLLVIHSAMDTMIVKARLPNGTGVDQFLFGSERESTLNVLHGLFQGDCRRRSDEEMNVIWHDHEFVEQKAALFAILLHDVNQEPSHAVRLKDGLRVSVTKVIKNVRISWGASCIRAAGAKAQDCK